MPIPQNIQRDHILEAMPKFTVKAFPLIAVLTGMQHYIKVFSTLSPEPKNHKSLRANSGIFQN